jgi:hypothetical protein
LLSDSSDFVTELTNLTWNQVSGICAEDGVTACAGTLAGKEFDGWTWATTDHVRNLFVNATEELTATMLDDGHAEVFDSPWAPQFLELFIPTFGFPDHSEFVTGWSADSVPDGPTSAFAPFMRDSLVECPPFCTVFDADGAVTNAVSEKANPLLGGVWLHRPVVTPEPASLLLVGHRAPRRHPTLPEEPFITANLGDGTEK